MNDVETGECCVHSNCNETTSLLPKKEHNSSANTVGTVTDTSSESSQASSANPTLAQCTPVPEGPPAATARYTTIRAVRSSNNGGVNYSTNTLLVYRLQDMRSLSNTNLCLAVLCLIYLGVNVTLVCVNYTNNKYVNEHGGSEIGEPVDDTVYHLVEFWATFCFAVVECIALAVTPKSQYSINGSMDPLFLKMVMFLNIVATSVPAVMISFSKEIFERASHEIEYLNELTMSFVDVVLLVSLWKSTKAKRSDTQSAVSENNADEGSSKSVSGDAWITTAIAMLVAIVQLGIYNLMGYNEQTQDMVGEVPAHFLEFSFEIISSLIAFWFCMDNKNISDKEIGMILYGNHEENCQICNNQMTEFALDHNRATTRYRQQYSNGYYQSV